MIKRSMTRNEREYEKQQRLRERLPPRLKPEGVMRIVCISDTHGWATIGHDQKPLLDIPDGDVLVCAGDICRHGHEMEVSAFDRFLEKLPHKHKILVAGNHDWCFERLGKERSQALLKNGIYLEDSDVVIDGVKFYGAPWQPEFFQWAFNVQRGAALAEKWALIPNDTDVLITHGPPFGILDITEEGEKVGCQDLQQAVTRVKPQLHVFGHIHNGQGMASHNGTTFINACVCDERYQPNNTVLYYDLKLPELPDALMVIKGAMHETEPIPH